MSNTHALKEIRDSIAKGELVVVVGTGCSISLTGGQEPSLSWKGLISSGFGFAKEKGKISDVQFDSWSSMLDSTDVDDTLSAAEYVGRKLGAPTGDLYARWLNQSFQHVKPQKGLMADAIVNIANLGVPICTLNYDSLLEQVTGLTSVNLVDVRKATSWMRREQAGILHLHGCWQEPETCVLGIRDYEKTLNSETRDLFQRALGAYKRLLFIGCGDTFGDPNFSALISWLRTNVNASSLQHYALVSNSQLQGRQSDEAWHGFVEPIAYGQSHSELPVTLGELFSSCLDAAKPFDVQPKKQDRSENLVAKYLEFLVRDCGQMTIEGLRADMDMAQRRFDLEKLFVPLELLPCPPDISLDDPERHEKLSHWRRKNKVPRAFGDVFRDARGLALLALPGGGKSLLLKRLAVAYASPDRRLKSNDGLPELDLVPVLIRCREWRSHIALPILTLLKSLPDITGQPELDGLGAALIPLFKRGKVLLLVDGLDEIHDNAGRTVFVENLRSFLDQYPLTKLIVTSREAGFNLIAPYLATHCERWRVAPLNEETIKQLCKHWHRLMVGESLEAATEAQVLGDVLTSNVALKKLAENPLLLTMLLVVKHGAGRLPPDKVSLYNRAVEVLLDTWNIKGHDALNVKEAIPQLAYVAYELMRTGKQTATEKELLTLLENARANVPQINRYAKDTPYDFLKRVELRSSLLLEGGHVIENNTTVPFYQFRHLTFQEYLAALAIVEGHYDGYDSKTPITKPLSRRLAADEWKEVVPMTAVLARKQAEPLIRALVNQGATLVKKVKADKEFPGRKQWMSYPGQLPSVVSRLAQSLMEEAQAEPKTLESALSLIVFFARGCHADLDWKALCRGPYAQELMHQAWLLYEPMDWHHETLIRNTFACLAGNRMPVEYWVSEDGQKEIRLLLDDTDPEKVCLGLMTSIGVILNCKDGQDAQLPVPALYPRFEMFIYSEHRAISHIAIWNWALFRYRKKMLDLPSIKLLDYLLTKVFEPEVGNENTLVPFALECCIGLPRDYWQPQLTFEQVGILRDKLRPRPDAPWERELVMPALIAFHSGKICSDSELAQYLGEAREHRGERSHMAWRIDQALEQIHPYGVDLLKKLRSKDDRDSDESELEGWDESNVEEEPI